MRRLVLLAALGLAVCAAAWCVWWLRIEQTGRVDTTSLPRRPLPLPTDGTSIAQSFAVERTGTGNVCVVVANTSNQERQLVLQVLTDDDGQPAHAVQRSVAPIGPQSSDCLALSWMPELTSTQRVLWVTARAVSAEASSDLLLFQTTGDDYAAGRLLVGDTEKWGDLALQASAPLTTRWHAGWPRALFRPASELGVVMLASTVLLLACAATWATAAAVGSPRSRAGTVLLAVVSAVAVQAAAEWTPTARAPRAWNGPGVSLLDLLNDATMHTSFATLADGFALVTSDIGATRQRALFALPTSEVRWRVNVTEPTSLDTAVALRQEAWTNAGDGVVFTVAVSQGATTDVLWQRHVDPFNDAGARRWHDVTIRLDRYVGREVVLTLSTTPGPNGNAVLDAAMWREPVLRRSVMR